MPNISTVATFSQTTTGFENLKYYGQDRHLEFKQTATGSDLGTGGALVQTQDDTGRWDTIEGGTIVSLPTNIRVTTPGDLRIVTQGGTPDFNVTIRLHGSVAYQG